MMFQDVMTQVAKFYSLKMACAYAEVRGNRWIVLGDNGQYWVTTYFCAIWLNNHGYKILEYRS